MVSMFADGQVLQPDECQSLGDRDGVIKHPPVPSGGRHCFCFGGTARIRRLFCVFFFLLSFQVYINHNVCPGSLQPQCASASQPAMKCFLHQ